MNIPGSSSGTGSRRVSKEVHPERSSGSKGKPRRKTHGQVGDRKSRRVGSDGGRTIKIPSETEIVDAEVLEAVGGRGYPLIHDFRVPGAQGTNPQTIEPCGWRNPV